MKNGLLGVGLIVLAVGCQHTETGQDGDARASNLQVGSTAVSTPAVPDVSGWIDAQSEGGTTVRLSLGPEPLMPGDFRVVIAIDDRATEPRSVDLVSPSMPVHGITRYDVRREGEHWTAHVHVPMAGDWSVFVNLGDGSDFAEARFTVDAEPAHAGVHH